MSKKINFNEYVYEIRKYPVEVEISNEDYKRLKNKEIDLEDISSKYTLKNTKYSGYSEQVDNNELDMNQNEDLDIGLNVYRDWEEEPNLFHYRYC